MAAAWRAPVMSVAQEPVTDLSALGTLVPIASFPRLPAWPERQKHWNPGACVS